MYVNVMVTLGICFELPSNIIKEIFTTSFSLFYYFINVTQRNHSV